jgi:mono/diheme cytochrome c family protein
MKQNAFSLRRFAGLLLFTVLAFTSLGFSAQAEPDLELGKKLYKQNCASCHKLDKKLVGPALAGVSQRRSEQWLIQWIRNNAALRASGDAEANAIFAEYGGSVMTNFPSLSDDDIRSIIAYTDAGDAPAAGAVPAAGAAASAAPVEDNSLVTLIILASFLTLFVVLLLRIRNTLKQVNGEQSTNLRQDLDGFTKLLIRNKRFMTFATVVLVLWFFQALLS